MIAVLGTRTRFLLLAVGVAAAGCGPSGVREEGSGPSPSATELVEDSSAPAESAFEDLEPGWTRLPPPPEVRVTTATAWTGEELIVWGGYVYSGYSDEVARDDGFVFSAASHEWRKMSPSPLEARAGPAAAWTGQELLIWGGSPSTSFGRFSSDGAAYDPDSDSWRELPPAPLSARAPLSVWTGKEFLLWGTAVRTYDPPRDGAAYNPSTDSWRAISEAPIELTDATAVWTGREMIVFGASLSVANNKAQTETAIGAAYDPATDTWRRLPDSVLSPQASTASWNGRVVIAWDYEHRSGAYDPEADKWRDLPRVPLEFYECGPESVALEPYVFGNYCGLMAVYDPADAKWHDVTRPEVAGWGFDAVPADPVVVLLGRDVESGEERMFAYRPPSW